MTADALYTLAEKTFREGVSAAKAGDVAAARSLAQKVGALGIKAQREGLSGEKFGKLLRAQAMLIERAS